MTSNSTLPTLVRNGQDRASQMAASGLGTRAEPVVMRITQVHLISDRLLHLAFRREDGRAFAFRPGQFCRVAVPTATGEVWRSYSISTPVEEGASTSRCEIALTAMPGGVATEYLFSRRVGDCIRVCGPFGRLVLPAEDPPHYLLIGTGTGMAPYRAMLPELDKRTRTGRPPRVTLLMGVRGPAECLYHKDFQSFVQRAPEHRQLLISYSRERPARSTALESRGYVQARLPDVELSPQHDRVLLCGNPDMIDTCTEMLIGRGFDKTRLVREKYLAGPAPR